MRKLLTGVGIAVAAFVALYYAPMTAYAYANPDVACVMSPTDVLGGLVGPAPLAAQVPDEGGCEWTGTHLCIRGPFPGCQPECNILFWPLGWCGCGNYCWWCEEEEMTMAPQPVADPLQFATLPA